MVQVLLLGNIRRSDLTERLKIIYRDKFALLETRGTQKSNDNDAVSATSMAYLVTVSYEAGHAGGAVGVAAAAWVAWA